MGIGLKWAAGGLLGVVLAAPMNTAAASDEPACELPNPFAPVEVRTESKAAKWRHGIHDMRVTWDKYFEVFPKELDGFEAASFEKIRAQPTFFLDRKVRFELYFGKSGTFFKPFISPFHQDGYCNFSAWGMGADLWTKEGRQEIHPLFYVDKRKEKMIDKLVHLPMYTPIHVWAEVRGNNEGQPWFEIKGFEIIPESVLSDAILRHLELGAVQLNKKRYELAAKTLEDGVKMELPVPVEAKVYGMLGHSYFELHQFNRARYALVQSILRDDSVVPYLVMLARTDLRLDRPEEARQACEKVIAMEPSNPEAYAELGLALAMLNDIRGAYRALDFAQRLAPRGQLPEAHRNRAMVAMREGKLTLAKEELSKAVLLRATDFSLHLELGDVYMAMGSLADARQEYLQAKDLSGLRPEPYYKVAVVLKAQGDALGKEGKTDEAKKFYEEALDNARQAIIKDENFTPAYGLEAELLRLLGKEAEIKKALLQGMEANPKSIGMQDVLYDQSVAAGDWEGMEQATRASLAIRGDARHYSRLGNILSSKPAPDYSGAAQAYEQAVAMAPSSGDDWAALAHIRVHMLKDYSGGASAGERAVAINKDNGGIWCDLALARHQLLDVEGSIAAATHASELSKSVECRVLLAQLKLGKNDFAGALELVTAAVADATLDTDKAWAQNVQAAALLNTGKVDEALEGFQNANAVLKDDPEHNLWYGYALQRKGDFSQALEQFNAAMANGRSSGSPLGMQVAADAAKASKTVAKLAKSAGKGNVEVVRDNRRNEQPREEANRKPAPPVIEENGNNKDEAVPAQVPGPR